MLRRGRCNRHIRPQYACRNCQTVPAAPVPAAVIDGGLAAPGLHAWVLIQKYLDRLPLYRIEKISERHGVPTDRSTLAQWVGELGVALQPLVDRPSFLRKQGKVLHADETPVQQLDPGKGKSKRAYLWACRSNDLEGAPRIAVFDYQTSRRGHRARGFLEDWRGHLMVDDDGGYQESFRHGVTELACLAHCRRKLFDLPADGGHPVAEEALRRIGELDAIAAQACDGDAATRLALRQQAALPRSRVCCVRPSATDWNPTPGSRTLSKHCQPGRSVASTSCCHSDPCQENSGLSKEGR